MSGNLFVRASSRDLFGKSDALRTRDTSIGEQNAGPQFGFDCQRYRSLVLPPKEAERFAKGYLMARKIFESQAEVPADSSNSQVWWD